MSTSSTHSPSKLEAASTRSASTRSASPTPTAVQQPDIQKEAATVAAPAGAAAAAGPPGVDTSLILTGKKLAVVFVSM